MRSESHIEVVSICAGQGDDVLGVLDDNSTSVADVGVRLIELDDRNVAVARRRAAMLPFDVEVSQADAGLLKTYDGYPRGDVVLVCGVFGNVTDEDVWSTIDSLAQLCNRGATVIWTRSRRAPDITPAIRCHFVEAGFIATDFVAPDDELWSVGVNRFAGEPQPLQFGGRMFEFPD